MTKFQLILFGSLLIAYHLNTKTTNQINGYNQVQGYETGLAIGAAAGFGAKFRCLKKYLSTEVRYELNNETNTESTYAGSHKLGLVVGFNL